MNCETAARTAVRVSLPTGPIIHLQSKSESADRATLYAAVAAAPAALGMKMVPMKNRRRRVASFAHDTAAAQHTLTHSHVLHAQKEKGERSREAF